MNIQMDLVPKERADEHAGVVVVDAKDRKELDEILSQDVYHAPGYAEYVVREFKAIMGKI
jgi:hypothetical protein